MREPETHKITEADESHSVDVHSRMFKYTLTMAIRVVCFIAAFFFLDSWFVWVCLAGAVLLPWVAVVVANGAGRDHLRESGASSVIDHAPQDALTAPEPAEEGPVTLEGEFYEDPPAAADAKTRQERREQP
ncbi:DUF3099 domain-containing protein [Zhihengliuella flava]|uniref:DUF3099 domain-containing protein n=1 Tax=Zhihengliuella flava TaxID=1285193 RepID=A0A931DBY2_9MICC|nr:DUF3099 domain-containing protein [Zhihengliuella flava]MBG6085768.1 hypothetical protein [Zhihengliuella flava]